MSNYSYEEEEALPYQGNEELIEEFFGSIFFFEKEGAIDRLRKFSELIGGGRMNVYSVVLQRNFPRMKTTISGKPGSGLT